MTLEEAINRFEKLASDYEFNLDMHQRNVMKLSVNDIERMKRNAQENRQLAEWLRELKKDRGILDGLSIYFQSLVVDAVINQRPLMFDMRDATTDIAIQALEQISHLNGRPCDVCDFHTEKGCSKWECVFIPK